MLHLVDIIFHSFIPSYYGPFEYTYTIQTTRSLHSTHIQTVGLETTLFNFPFLVVDARYIGLRKLFYGIHFVSKSN